MGKLIDRYIGKTVAISILAVLGIILGLSMLFAYIDELTDLTDGYGPLQALQYILITIPRRVYELLPMTALIGCLVGLGTLASKSELTVMRAAGVSLSHIVWAVMKPMLVLMVAGVLIGEYVAPWSESIAQSQRALAQGQGDAQSSKRGLWHRQGNEFIHINAVQPRGIIYGVTRYHFDDDRVLKTASFAKRAIHRGDHWMLEGIATTYLLPEEKRSVVIYSTDDRWDVQLDPELLNTVLMEPERLPLTGLWRYIHYLAEQELNTNRYWLAFWTKLLQPLVTATLVLLAISFIFGPLRTVTMGQRLFTGVLIGFVFQIAQDLLGPSSLVFNFPPLLAVVIPALVCAMIGMMLLRRAG